MRGRIRTTQNDLFLIEGSRVPVVGRLDIGVDLRADLWDLTEELDGDLLGFFLQIIVLQRSVLSVKGQCQRDLSGQIVHDILQLQIQLAVHVVELVSLVSVVSGEQDLQQLDHDRYDLIPVGQIEYIHVIDVASLIVVLEDQFYDLIDFASHFFLIHYRNPSCLPNILHAKAVPVGFPVSAGAL